MTKPILTRNDFQSAVELINKSKSVLITTHTKSDGDAVGCCVALEEALIALGKKVQILFLSPLPQWYAFLLDHEVPVLGVDLSPEQLMAGGLGSFDLIIIVDTNSFSQLPKFDKYLKESDTSVLVIDHHKTSDKLGDVEIVDSSAAAASCVVLDLLRFAHWPITTKIAQAIFAGITSDTGWFHFNNTDSRCYRDCAELTEAGAKPSLVYHSVFQSFSPQRFHLMTVMFNTLQLHFNDRVATQYLTQQDFKTTGAKYEDTENLIDECQRIGSVEVAALFVELSDGRIRCSLRSRGVVDVAQIAATFGGGGHTAAAGAYLPGPLENAKQLILDLVKVRLG
jgi:bifunctional oligoribonuclease and PAP phosphatase NrnA